MKYLQYQAIQKQALVDKYQWRYEMYKDAKPAVEKQCRGDKLTDTEKTAIKKASVPEEFTSEEKLENIQEKLDITKESLNEARQELYFVKEQIKENLSVTDVNTDTTISRKRSRTDNNSDSNIVMADTKGPGSGGGSSGSETGSSGSGTGTFGSESSNFESGGDNITSSGNNSIAYFDINMLISSSYTETLVYFFILIQFILPYIKYIFIENYKLYGLSYNLFIGIIKNIYFLLYCYIIILLKNLIIIYKKYKDMCNRFLHNN